MKKLIIELDEVAYDLLTGKRETANIDLYSTLIQSVQKGTPLPDNATNGEVIKALFDNEMAYNLEFYIKNYMLCTDWWNAPYKLSELKGENK